MSALFCGASGTGKTMAAEVLANELQLDLFRIDLSSVVSRYIGETEKNLARIFEAAEAGGAILLFDEAEALFGKRSEVKDSHDRFANIQVSFRICLLTWWRQGKRVGPWRRFSCVWRRYWTNACSSQPR